MDVFERLGGQHLARTGSGAVVLVAPAAADADDHSACAVLPRARDESSADRSGTRSRIRCRVMEPSRVQRDTRNTPERTENPGGPGRKMPGRQQAMPHTAPTDDR
ncbi:MAG: hypothetical protein K2X56_05210 [Mycobacterium pseudokansasii]|uniref:hypothetical protein n=1 Tax=Mycobacterium pseudokansasii TaxID=2341080 RepID=UPI00055B8F06|nr:hypothetical protein [Mycobacterium pseudokansasii]KZS66699.1 hypothetical protein A4G27_06735 [Mycobacterium kansasii]MBY0387503.1 hypothetical protein [Mycobacterium pseudokansasii]